MGATRVFTYNLVSASITISKEDNVQHISVQTNSGTVNVSGDLIFKNLTSTPVPLVTGEGVTLSSSNFGNPIDGVTIDALGGDCDIVITVS